jgi:hypothetical protein
MLSPELDSRLTVPWVKTGLTFLRAKLEVAAALVTDPALLLPGVRTRDLVEEEVEAGVRGEMAFVPADGAPRGVECFELSGVAGEEGKEFLGEPFPNEKPRAEEELVGDDLRRSSEGEEEEEAEKEALLRGCLILSNGEEEAEEAERWGMRGLAESSEDLRGLGRGEMPLGLDEVFAGAAILELGLGFGRTEVLLPRLWRRGGGGGGGGVSAPSACLARACGEDDFKKLRNRTAGGEDRWLWPWWE